MTAHALYQARYRDDRYPAPSYQPVLREAAEPMVESQQADDGFVVDVAGAMRRIAMRSLAVLAMIVVALFLFFTASVQAGDAVGATDTHIVGQGETLWEIAAENTAPGGDVRSTVADIKALNQITTSVISAGQTLTVPAVE